MAKLKVRFGRSRDTIVRKHIELGLPLHKDKPTGHYYAFEEEILEWELARAQKTKLEEIKNKIVKGSTLKREAEDDFRFILFYGREPSHSPHWRNAKFIRSDLPADIVAGFALDPRAGFEVAVEHADKLLSLPSVKQAEAMAAIAARLTAYHGDEV